MDIDRFIEQRTQLANISCKSHIVTVFGDVISPHGDWVWLGSLIDALAPLGFSERLVRTSVFRLVKDDWLQVRKAGRKSYYAFTDSAARTYTKTARRIYSGKTVSNQGRWLILLPSFVGEDKLPALKRQLLWLGFSQLASGVYAHPSMDKATLHEMLVESELSQSVIVFDSRTLGRDSNQVLKKLVHERWQVEALQRDYRLLIDCYQPLIELVKARKMINDRQSFLLRTLLIHEYRRILLKDHELPAQLLPKNWLASEAKELVKTIYAELARSSSRFITGQMKNLDGLLPSSGQEFLKRFK